MTSSLKLKVTAIIAVLGLFGISLYVSKIRSEWLQIEEAQSLSGASHALARLSDASIRISLERSLTQLTLSLDEPVPTEFRRKLDDQRATVDAGFKTALDYLARGATEEFKTVSSLVKNELNELSKLRREADQLLSVSMFQRPADRINAIPDALKSLVLRLYAARLQLRGSASNIMTTVALLEQAQDRAIKLREFAGRDRTYLATAIARGEPFSEVILVSMSQLHGRAQESMIELEALTNHTELPPKVRDGVDEIRRHYFGTYAKVRDEVIAEGTKSAPSYSISFSDFFKQSSMALNGAEDLGIQISSEIEEIWAIEEANAKSAVTIQGGTLVFLVALSAIAVWMVFALFLRLDRLRLTMNALTAGALDIVVPEIDRRDEIGEMARTVKHFQDVGLAKLSVEAAAAAQRAHAETASKKAAEEKAKLETAAESERKRAEELRLIAAKDEEAASKERALAIEKVGHGLSRLAVNDLSVRITGDMPPAYHKLMEDFNAAVSNLATTLGAIRDGTEAIATGAREISQAADDLSRRTESQAASLEETAGAVVEISSAIKVSAQNAASARDYVAEANRDAEASSSIVEHAVTAMTAIEASSKEISQIISVIDEIAFQTNLLALNAGVEAARAGEAGRGFAVVATEVRALAQRSADAAKQIRTLISNSSGQVTQGVSLVGDAGDALQRIMARVTEINGLVAAISTQAEEQSMGLTQVSTTVTQMDQATQQNAAMVEETTAATRNLSEETQRLLNLVAQFKLGSTNNSRQIASALAASAPHMRDKLRNLA